MTTAEINGTTIRYEDSGGDGPAILFSHGFLMNHTMFDEQVAELSESHRCIRWDERGFGDTTAPGPFDYWDSANDAIGVLDAAGVDKAVLVGMSQGGFLSLRAALAHPDRVAAVVLIDSCADLDDEATIEGYHGMLGAFTGDDDEVRMGTAQGVAGLILGDEDLAAQWIPGWLAGDKDQLMLAGQALLSRDDISGRMGEIACPVLVIHGSDDQAITLDRAQAVADTVQDSRGVVVVNGAAHAPNMSHPAEVNAALTDFLAGL